MEEVPERADQSAEDDPKLDDPLYVPEVADKAVFFQVTDNKGFRICEPHYAIGLDADWWVDIKDGKCPMTNSDRLKVHEQVWFIEDFCPRNGGPPPVEGMLFALVHPGQFFVS